MKKWSVLSIPLIGLAGLGIWAQSLAAVPANQPTGVVVVDPVASSTSSSSTSSSGSSVPGPASTSSASAPDRFRSPEAPRRLDMAQPQTTEQAEAEDADDDGTGIVQHVEPTQVTSPAVASPGGSASPERDDRGSNDSGLDDSGPDDSAGLAESGGTDD